MDGLYCTATASAVAAVHTKESVGMPCRDFDQTYMIESLTIKSSKQSDLSDESWVEIRHVRVYKTESIDNVMASCTPVGPNFSDGVRAVIYPFGHGQRDYRTMCFRDIIT